MITQVPFQADTSYVTDRAYITAYSSYWYSRSFIRCEADIWAVGSRWSRPGYARIGIYGRTTVCWPCNASLLGWR